MGPTQVTVDDNTGLEGSFEGVVSMAEGMGLVMEG